jgi:hypothetical protein
VEARELEGDVSVESLVCQMNEDDEPGSPLGSGKRIVKITGVAKTELEALEDFESGNTLMFTEDADLFDDALKIKAGKFKLEKNSNGNALGLMRGRRDLAVLGTKKTLVVRVTAADAATTASAPTLSDKVFGTGGDEVNLKTWFDKCSHGGVNFDPATSVDNPNIVNGVTEISITMNVIGKGDSEVREAVKSALDAQLQGDWRSKYDHTMLCLPPGTLGGWIGYAYIGHYLSVFNDQWCTYPSLQLHEIGHNLAMGHSGEGSRSSNQYDDMSGMMGYSYSQDSTKMCFNGAKMWFLGWFVEHAEEVDPIVTPQWSGNLVGVATFSEQLNENVVVKIETDPNGLQCRDCYDFYIAFNRATGFNSGTKEGHNQVLITEQGDGQSNAKSLLVAKLSEGMAYTIVDFGGVSGDSVTVTVNSIDLNAGLANISINNSNGSPAPTAPTPPTKSPTASPTVSPTVSPTGAPTIPSPPCMDMFGDVNGASPWVDADGLPYNCAWYSSGLDNCANYGSGYANCGTDGDGDGILDWTLSDGSCPTGNIVCCTCGGGVVPPVEGTGAPTLSPTTTSSTKPSASPSSSPVATPSNMPSAAPSASPTANPSSKPSVSPSGSPVDPATDAPTKAPVASPPTDDGCVDGTLSVTLDNYGSETNWKVIETATSTTMGQHAGSSGTMPLTCLKTDMYYHFAITDTWGDGMCCSYGEGSYDLQVNGLTVKAGGEFSSAEEVMFKPTPQDSDVELKFVYKMDSWPKETEWALESDMDGLMGSQAYNTYKRANKQVVIEAAVDPANCYTLRVGDGYGDGLVNGAYWQVYWNGDLMYDFGAGRPNGNFGNVVSVDIGNGCGDAPATASSTPSSNGKVPVSVTMDSPGNYGSLSHAKFKEAPGVQDDSEKGEGDVEEEDESESDSGDRDDNEEDEDVDNEKDDKEEEGGGGGRGWGVGGVRARGFQGGY